MLVTDTKRSCAGDPLHDRSANDACTVFLHAERTFDSARRPESRTRNRHDSE